MGKKTLCSITVTYCLFCIMLLTADAADIQINPDLLSRSWTASWVAYPDGPFRDYGVFHFRKTLELDTIPSTYIIHVSADNRYRLHVNGEFISFGPARSDLNHWRYESLDIAPYLKKGKNVLAAVVWNYGVHSAVWQHSFRTGFIVQGNGPGEETASTPDGWKCIRNDAYTAIPTEGRFTSTFCVVGPCEDLEAAKYPWGWEQPSFDDSAWADALSIGRSQPMELFQWNNRPWMMTPRTIPQMEETHQRFARIARQTNANVQEFFLAGRKSFTIPANTSAVILFDNGVNTTAYPELTVEGGKGSSIKLIYAEALFSGRTKGNRDETEGKEIIGYNDIFRPDGTALTYRPLYWRTFRYIQMEITTAGAPLTVKDFLSDFTSYPHTNEAVFESSDPENAKMWEIGWRTFRLCANETYFDCPYYEQMLYTGDARVEMMVDLTSSLDDRLAKDTILQFYYSLQPEGLMQDRYPSHEPQYIPTYSLDWICLLHELWYYRGEEDFIRPLVSASRPILDWFEARIGDDGVLRNVSWRDPGYDGPMPADWNRPNARLTQEYILALKDAVELEKAFGLATRAEHYQRQIPQLRESVYKAFWVPERGMLAETQAHEKFSQHVNVMGILADVIPAKYRVTALENTFLSPDGLIRERQSQSSFFWMHYLHKAMAKAGMGDRYLEMLEPWRDEMKNGLTTWPETYGNSRSDCHAWSASPNINFLAIVCGITSASPGFKEVSIAPNLCDLEWVKGKMPHPDGFVSVNLKRAGASGISAEVTLPQEIFGTFTWNGKTVLLHGGSQTLTL